MFRRFSIAALILAALFFLQGESSAITWQSSLDSAMAQAMSSGKPIMADFYTEWCGWCKKLDSDTYSDRTVNGLAEQFVCVKIDGDKEKGLIQKYGVKGFPTIIFMKADGAVIDSVIGYRAPDPFAKIMNAVLEKFPKKIEAKTEAKIEAKKAQRETESDEFRLDGIIYDPVKPRAIVNDKIVKVGESVNGANVRQITADKVTLDINGRKLELTIK